MEKPDEGPSPLFRAVDAVAGVAEAGKDVGVLVEPAVLRMEEQRAEAARHAQAEREAVAARRAEEQRKDAATKVAEQAEAQRRAALRQAEQARIAAERKIAGTMWRGKTGA